jgi:GAF domain-containing protein
MKCPRCQHESAPPLKFCGECGTPLKAATPGGAPEPSYAEVAGALREALEQQTATSEILGVISRSPMSLEPVFSAILERATRLCGAHLGMLGLYDGERYRQMAHQGATPEFQKWLYMGPRSLDPRTGVGRMLQERRPIHIADLAAEPLYLEWNPDRVATVEIGGARTFLAVPMLKEGQVVGGVVIYRPEVRPFTAKQIDLVQTFANQAVIAIENVRLFKELEDKNSALMEALEQQTATAEILGVISNSPTDIQPVLDAVAASAARVCGATDALIMSVEGQDMRRVAHFGPIPLVLPEVRRITRGSTAGHAILEGQPIHVHDILDADAARDYPETAAAYRHAIWRTTLAVPLVREGVAIGAITIRRIEVRPFTDKQIKLLETFANQAVIAIENVRLFKELEGKNRDLTTALEQQTATGDILKIISRSGTDVQPVFDAIADSALRLLRGWGSLVVRFDHELLQVAAIRGGRPGSEKVLREQFPMPLVRGFFPAEAILDREVKQIADVETEDVGQNMRARARARGWRANLAVPMLQDGRAIGVITVSRAEPGAFSLQEVELLKTFADQALIAIENARLLTELQRRTQELTRSVGELRALGEVGHAISSTLDLQTVLDTIVARATQLAGVDAGVIYEYDEHREVFEPRATHHLEEEIVQTLATSPVRKGEGATGRLAEVREPIQLPDIRLTTLQSQVRDVLLRAGYRGLLAVPLLREDHLIGGLTVIRKVPGEFGPEIVQLLTTFATQSALAIQNARLFREIEAKSHELEALSRNMEQLYRLSTAMQEPLSLKEQLGRVLETATRIGLLDRIYVWAVSPEGDQLVNLAGAGFAEDEWKQFEGFTIPLVEAGAMHRSLREGRPLLFDDENPLPRDLYLKPQYLLKGLRTSRFLVIPMIARGETVGVLAGDNKPSGRSIARETVELLQTFASHAAVAIANARLFQTIEEKSRELEIASRHKSEFLANMSHELRTPLNAIIGFSEALTERMFGDLNEKQDEYLRDIYESGQHLLSLINDILDLAKIEAGRMELELTEFDLPQAISNALTLVRERAGRRGIALHQAVDQRLGRILGDERKVKQVLLNLLSNALKFTPEGGQVDVRASVIDGMAEMSVTDTGVGIAPEDQEAVFEEFRQVGRSEGKAEGTGLGLTLCRKFIELHGGRIWVKSQVGVGSTFTFTIPVRRDPMTGRQM